MPRHSWLGSAVVWWWLLRCHSWLRVLVAGPRPSRLGFAAACGGWSLATPATPLPHIPNQHRFIQKSAHEVPEANLEARVMPVFT